MDPSPVPPSSLMDPKMESEGKIPEESISHGSDEIQKFYAYNQFLERRETRKATRMICEMMEHDTIGCDCFQNLEEEAPPPEKPKMIIVQPDRKYDGNHEMSVAGIFLCNASTSSPLSIPPESLLPHLKFMKKPGESTRKPYSYKDKKQTNAQERREIKKKLFMDLGIVRTNCGIDNEEKNREEAMKRKVTETIVTTYCELCEQNFSSSKMLLLHRSKVHKTPFIECHLCLKLFSQTIQFNRHMKTHYGPNAMRFVQCEHCDRQFKDKEALKTHWEVSHRNELVVK